MKISVRDLVEFILRSGDIDNTKRGRSDGDAMQQGSRMHRKIQKRMGSNYRPEVPLSISVPVGKEGEVFEITVEGRADGVISQEDQAPKVIIDEIKSTFLDIRFLKEPIGVHRAQVMCYGYIYAKEHQLEEVGIRLTYCNLVTEALTYFDETLSLKFLEDWFLELVEQYSKWAIWQQHWISIRNQSMKQLEFPFSYRQGQKDLVTGVYKTIIRNKKLYIEAPTGVGKTISTVFPTMKAMGEEKVEKVFYLTAKTITRTVAEETFRLLVGEGMKMKVVTITAKDKICILPKAQCNPKDCPRAKGHYDRVNNAVFDLLTNEDEITRDIISQYGEKHNVCPFEMCLDTTNWADGVICDYNYVFDPNVYLRRFFALEKKRDFVFLVDEAHNLVDRAREMYSSVLYKQSFLDIIKIVEKKSIPFVQKLKRCHKDFVEIKRRCDEFLVLDHIGDLALNLMRLMGEYEGFLEDFSGYDGQEQVLEFYMELRHFMNIYELMDERYCIYGDYHEERGFRIKLQCMDPSKNLDGCFRKGKSAVLFSATLLPIQYYKEQLAGTQEDYAIYAPSTFPQENRLLMIGRGVSTKYSSRTPKEYEKIVNYIEAFIEAKGGNYLVFFPSYGYLKIIEELFQPKEGRKVIVQKGNMSEEEREEFLSSFYNEPGVSKIGFCVMGGIFSEGIDLKGDRLIGVVIVGTGLPMVCNERELFRQYYQDKKGDGFSYAYLYNGMNKVLQSAGRVIRTAQDQGAILLLDERFQQAQYTQLFPREWFPHLLVEKHSMREVLDDFWENKSVTGAEI